MKTLVCFGDSITADEILFDGTPRLTPRLQEMFQIGKWLMGVFQVIILSMR